jgi:hypothetical protein
LSIDRRTAPRSTPTVEERDMPAVNWDQPSTGLVSDGSPSLTLDNAKGGALQASSRGVALDAVSKDAEALRARTGKTLTARITSEEFIAAMAFAPKATGVIGVNQSATVAVAGVNLVDPAKPVDSRDGIGVAGISNRFVGFGVVGATFGPRSTGVWGNAQAGGVGVRGTGSTGGVEGGSTQGNGVSGVTQSDRAAGVFGFGPGVLGAGVAGQSAGGAGVDGRSSAGPGVRGMSAQAQGVVGESTGSNASGVFGRNDLGNGTGVDGSSQAGIGVRALSSKGTALYAESISGLGLDVSNFSTSQPALKAYGPIKPGVEASSFNDAAVRAIGVAHAGVVAGTLATPKAGEPEVGCGVYGNSLAGAGVCGLTVTGTGVLGIGYAKAGGWAGRFQGNVFVDGMLFKSASLFSIDHPLDPKRKVLNHACVEAPEYKTFYDGVATLNGRGEAIVKLPRWFDALNHELRYQLTAIGAPAPDLHVAREAKDGSFAIAGGRPKQRVCWQVTGVRRDAWAKANPLLVEQSRKSARGSTVPVTSADVKKATDRIAAAAKAVEASDKARRKAHKKRELPSAPPAPVQRPASAGADAVDDALKRLLHEVKPLLLADASAPRGKG